MISENEFSNKNIVITGASSGIGLCAAFYFLNCNSNVVLGCQDEVTMRKICQENKFVNAAIIKADLEKKNQVESFISYVIKIFPTVDILINCAGIKLDNDVEKTCGNDFDYTIRLNLRSVFILIKELRPYFSENASIINLSCLYGSRPMYGVISYAMSKAGLETLTRYAAAEFSQFNIRINAISACPVDTNSLRYVKVSESGINYFNKQMEKYIPLGRIAEADDIVKVIIFLASKRSSKITGQIIKVDGGRSLTSSGYVHYKGLYNMNSKFEPDEVSLKGIFENYFNKKKLDKPIKDKDELNKFISETIAQSNFSTRNRDATFVISSNYYKVKESDSILSSRFLKGSIPNPLLFEKKDKTFGNMSYNPEQNPFKFPKLEKELYYSQNINNRINNEENNINNNLTRYVINKEFSKVEEKNNENDEDENGNSGMKEN